MTEFSTVFPQFSETFWNHWKNIGKVLCRCRLRLLCIKSQVFVNKLKYSESSQQTGTQDLTKLRKSVILETWESEKLQKLKKWLFIKFGNLNLMSFLSFWGFFLSIFPQTCGKLIKSVIFFIKDDTLFKFLQFCD